ncbi:ABC transporter permease [Paracoccus sphaerophysae]|uniref:ABC transporter permease n=1 Tax=Paracoccus sphaerophysae TaxID=690417 RepID=UPI002353D4FC|nr:ABC transporter permease subunit [Paracoccus sphaerophysae]
MKRPVLVPAVIAIACAAFFALPLIATFHFSLKMTRGTLSLDSYRSVMSSDVFVSALGFSAMASLAAIVLGVLIVVPTAYWVRLKLPRMRPFVEFLSLLPLIIPPVVLVFGYVRIYGTQSLLPLTMTQTGTTVLLIIGYVVLSLPYMYRAVDNGMGAIDIATLTEAAESLGASRLRTVMTVIFPNVRAAILSGAFLTFSISLGEFVMTSLLNRPGLGPYMVQIGQDRAYEPAAIAIMAFGFTWGCMILMSVLANHRPGAPWLPRFLTLRRRTPQA